MNIDFETRDWCCWKYSFQRAATCDSLSKSGLAEKQRLLKSYHRERSRLQLRCVLKMNRIALKPNARPVFESNGASGSNACAD